MREWEWGPRLDCLEHVVAGLHAPSCNLYSYIGIISEPNYVYCLSLIPHNLKNNYLLSFIMYLLIAINYM